MGLAFRGFGAESVNDATDLLKHLVVHLVVCVYKSSKSTVDSGNV